MPSLDATAAISTSREALDASHAGAECGCGLRYNFSQSMASLRRHLASLGLAVVFCHVVMQVLVPAALCCQKPLAGTGSQGRSARVLPDGLPSREGLPDARQARRPSRSLVDPGCAARPVVDLHDMLMTLSSGGVVPTLVALARPMGSESAPASCRASRVSRRRPFLPVLPPAPEPASIRLSRSKSVRFREESMTSLHVLLGHGARRLPFVQLVVCLAGLCVRPVRRRRRKPSTTPASADASPTRRARSSPGAQVTARQIETNIDRDAVTDRERALPVPVPAASGRTRSPCASRDSPTRRAS